jgi:15-cis-phytoene synthase
MAEEAAAPILPGAGSDTDYIPGLVRSGDQDRYLAGLLAPRTARDHLFALYAFNIELARIGERVTEPQLGEIRLEWWRNVLETPAGEPAAHPVAAALIAARAACDLPDALLAGMIDARGVDVQREPIASTEALDAYLHATAGAVFRLGAWIAGARDDSVAKASEAAAIAYGLTGVMRALPYHAARGQLYLPADFLRAFGVDGASILAGEESDGLRNALAVLRDRAREHYLRFRALSATLPTAALPAFLPLALVPAYLRRLGHPRHRPLNEIAEVNPLGRFTRIWLAHLRGRI